MFAERKCQPSFIPVFCVRQTISSHSQPQKLDCISRWQNSFLPATPSVPCKIKSKHLSMYPNPRRRCSSGIFAADSSTHTSSEEEVSPVIVICTIIHAAFEQALAELMFPSRHNATFLKCYELVGAILYAKRNHISIRALEQELHSFSHSERCPTLPVMSELQRHTVRAFLVKIYTVDDLLEKRNHIGTVKYTPHVNPSRVEYHRLWRIVKQGRLMSDVLKEMCECNIGTLRDIVSEKPPEVLSRDGLPSRWANVLAVLTAYLREHISSR